MHLMSPNKSSFYLNYNRRLMGETIFVIDCTEILEMAKVRKLTLKKLEEVTLRMV